MIALKIRGDELGAILPVPFLAYHSLPKHLVLPHKLNFVFLTT